jgi:hypothetical protein
MSESDERIEHAIRKVIGDTLPTPAQPSSSSDFECPTVAAAITRCRDAWQQAYDDYIQKNARKDGSLLEMHAERAAAAAFRAAMPALAHWMGIRDFIGCVAYGVLIDAIPPERTGQLLYAAQTALALLPRMPNL